MKLVPPLMLATSTSIRYKINTNCTKCLIQKLKAKQTKYEAEISTKMVAFEKKVKDFQQKAQTMSQFEGQTKQQELAEEEQRLYKLRDDFYHQISRRRS
jgi:hypothetical protein